MLYAGQKERKVYLPKGEWKDFHSGECYNGGQELIVKTPIDIIPVFEKLK